MTLIATRAMLLPAAVVAVAATCIAPAAAEPRTGGTAASRKDAKLATREQELEAVALQILLAPMFNSSRKGLMGTGTAGRHWEGMMVEHIARQLARQGKFRLLPAERKDGRPSGPEAVLRLRSGPAPVPCTGGACRPAAATIGEWQTTVAHAAAPESPQSMDGVMARDRTERTR